MRQDVRSNGTIRTKDLLRQPEYEGVVSELRLSTREVVLSTSRRV